NATKPKAGIWMYETAAGSALQFGTSNALATGITNQAMTIDTAGNVGIGTTSPSYPLHVVASAAAIYGSSTGMAASAVVGSNPANVGVQGIGYAGVYGLGTVYGVMGVGSGTGVGGYFSGTTYGLIVASGNVGIGTTAPATLLHVNGVQTIGLNGGTGGQITFNGATSGSVALKVAAAAGTGTVFQLPANNGTNGYLLQTDGNGVTSWVAGGGGTIGGSGTANYVARWLNATTIGTGKLYDNGTNVGIGTNNPAALLEVRSTNTATSGYVYGTALYEAVAPTAASSSTSYGNYTNTTSSTAYNITGTLVGSEGRVTNGNTGTVTSAKGAAGMVYNASTGTITNAMAVNAGAINDSTGTITSAFALRGGVQNSSTGTITNAYGAYLYVDNVNATQHITTGYGLVIGTIDAATPYSIYASDANAPSYFAGNVGIGTTAPANALDIGTGGGIHIQAGTPTSTAAALYNVGGTLYWNGTALGSGGGGTITGSGTANYVARWTDTSALGTGVLYDNGTNVGIGTNNPAALLEVRATNTATSGYVYGTALYEAVAPTAASSSTSYGNYTNTTSSTAYNITGTLVGSEGRVTNGNTGTVTSAKGAAGMVYNASTGTITNAMAVNAGAINDSTGTITSAFALRGGVQNSSTGTITNAYGAYLYVDNVNATQHITTGYGLVIGTIDAATPYSIYASDANAPSYFAGNVGIGTTVPVGALHINKNAGAWSSNNYSAGLVVQTPGSNTSIALLDYAGGNPWAIANVNGSVPGTLTFAAMPAIGNTSTAPVYVVNITPAGNVGIGTTVPAQKLHVAGTIQADNSIYFNGTKGLVTHDGTNYSIVNYGLGSTLFYNYTGSSDSSLAYQFHTTTSNTPVLSILNNGNVGIGTTAPLAKLTVGNAHGGAAASTTFTTDAGSLGTSAADSLILGSIGFTTGNLVSLGIHALRTAAGSSWTTTAMGLVYDVDSTSPVNNSQIWMTSTGNVGIGTTAPNSTLQVYGSVATKPPVTMSANNYTVDATDYTLISGYGAPHYINLPAASSYPGRMLIIKGYPSTSYGVYSNASNVTQPNGTQGTVICNAGVVGRWAMLQSNGTYWVMIAHNN
ncbi:MAG: hypothetical protein WC521_09085, partial [Bdellovibrionales bacterium]